LTGGAQSAQRSVSAIELLTQGKRVVDVALELGYSDQSHLTRALKAIMGRTPGEVAGD
jgi:AraC-like DNA-binding protein